jgi:sulfoxide reductase heme-binding subunit YedZ
MLVAASNPQALWYMTRGFGLSTLLLLTASMVIGITEVVRFASPSAPRFVVARLHKNISLMAILFLAIHIATSVADPYAPIGVIDAFVPFVGKYRPIWLGFGALATDLLIALALSSLVRQRVGYRAWRIVHWSAYACWPIAIVHGLGTGSDATTGWVQLLYVACVLMVFAALVWRLSTRWSPASAGRRLTAAASAVMLIAAVGAWAAQGPLRSGWAHRAGTPPSLLGGQSSASFTPSHR